MANMIEQSLLCKVLDAPDLEILHSNGVIEEMFLTCKDELKDDTSGFYGVSNPCDYILFRSPYLFLVELKTHKGKSLPIAKIRPNQIQGMEKATHYEGVYGGFLINFRELEETYYITVQDVIQFTQTEERKSIPVEWCRDHGVKIEQKKKRVRYSYDLESWLRRYYGKSV